MYWLACMNLSEGRRIPTVGLMIVLTLAIGGGSLVLFGYFLSAGAPPPIATAQPDTARLFFDSLLCLLFFAQHSGMIRPSAKARIATYVPEIYVPALYSIASGIVLLSVVLLWQPTDHVLYRLHGLMRWFPTAVSLAALAGFAWSVHSLRGFDPFGTLPLRAAMCGVRPPSSDLVVRGAYRHIRHPLYLFVLVLIWATPRLSTDRLLFNVLWTAWIVVGTWLEERDLLGDFGDTYRQYQGSVPMLIPRPSLLRLGCEFSLDARSVLVCRRKPTRRQS